MFISVIQICEASNLVKTKFGYHCLYIRMGLRSHGWMDEYCWHDPRNLSPFPHLTHSPEQIKVSKSQYRELIHEVNVCIGEVYWSPTMCSHASFRIKRCVPCLENTTEQWLVAEMLAENKELTSAVGFLG